MKTQIRRLVGWLGLGALSLLFSTGCTTNPGMRGSPFYSGDFKHPPNTTVTNRIPAWPLLYYRDPALSVLWPIFESVEGESFAVRPLFSSYDYDSPTNSEWNVLWPWIQQNNATHEGRAFPFFWGEDYAVGFPLWWHFAAGKSTSDLLIPLWWSKSSANEDKLYTLLFGYAKEGADSSWLAPLLLSGGSSGPDHSSTTIVWPLTHFSRDGADTSSHVLPIYYWDSKSGTFLSLPYCSWNSDGMDHSLILPLLAASASDGHGRGEFWALAGLYNREWDRDGLTSDYLFPLYVYSPSNYLYSLLFGFKGPPDDRFTYYCTPLIGSSRNDAESSAWVFPLWHHSADTNDASTRGHFLWSTWRTSPSHASSQMFPFWGHERTTTDARNYEHTGALLWLYGNTSDKTPEREESSSHILPLWYQSQSKTPATGESYQHASYLLSLYDTKHEISRDPNAPGGINDYERKALLGYAWRKEVVNGDVSVDTFPGIAYDKKKDGYTQTSWLLRMFRWERDAQGKRKLDICFIPFIRD